MATMPPPGPLPPSGGGGLPPMGGQQMPMPLFNPPPRGNVTQAKRLTEMVRTGRVETNGQRSRWQRNREAYKGNIYLVPTAGQGSQWRQLNGPVGEDIWQKVTVNTLRSMVDGRVAMLTGRMPSSEVIPPQNTIEALDGARTAEKLIEYQWDDVDGWNIGRFARTLMRVGEQDGIAMACVMYDRTTGPLCMEMIGIDPQTGQDIGPLQSYEQVRAAIEQDPQGESLWRAQWYPCGDVVFRVVRCGALAFDPTWATEWRECKWVIESRRRTIDDLERELGAPLETVFGENWNKSGTGIKVGGVVNTVDEAGRNRPLDTKYELVCHELFARATSDTGEWPQGAHILWVDSMENTPLIEEPWVWPNGDSRQLPFRPFIPRPDDGPPLRSKGTTEELLPIALDMHRRLQQYAEWMELVAKPILLLNGGILRSPSVFNVERAVETSPGLGTPQFMQVPTNPGDSLLAMIQFYKNEMAEMAELRAATRGEAPGQGVNAAAAINALINQDEQMMSDTESELRECLEWACGEALTNVEHFFTISRVIQMPGIEDEAAFESFMGANLYGAKRWKIKEPLQPKSQAQRQQMMMQFLQYAGDRFDATPFMREFIEGDVDRIVQVVNSHVRKQEHENRLLSTIGARKDIDDLWANFTRMRDDYIRQMQELEAELQQRYLETGVHVETQNVAQQLGIMPPRVLDMLKQAGVRVPQIEPLTDRHILHCAAMERWMAGDGFGISHPAVQQAAREHFTDHVEQEARGTKMAAAQMPQMQQATPGAQPMAPEAGAETSDPISEAAQPTMAMDGSQ